MKSKETFLVENETLIKMLSFFGICITVSLVLSADKPSGTQTAILTPNGELFFDVSRLMVNPIETLINDSIKRTRTSTVCLFGEVVM